MTLCRRPVINSVYAIPILLTSRLLVGVCTGMAFMPSVQVTVNQCVALLAIFALLLAWLLKQRPFLVPAANLCECVVVLLQLVTVLLNFAYVGDDEGHCATAGGVGDAAATSEAACVEPNEWVVEQEYTFLGLNRAEALKAQTNLITNLCPDR